MAGQGDFKGVKFEAMQEAIKDAEDLVIEKLDKIKEESSEKVNVGAMFDLQWMMNKFTQICEGASSVLQACHGAIQSITRGIK